MSNFGFVSYGTGAIAFAALLTVLAIGYCTRRTGRVLLLAVATNAAWLAVTAYAFYSEGVALFWVPILETIRNGAWYAFLLYILGFSLNSRGIVRALALLSAGLVLLQEGVLVGFPWLERLLGVKVAHEIALTGQVLLAVIGLILVEQLLRSVPQGKLWAIKYLCLGLAGLFVYDLFLYADALLLHAIDTGVWSTRGLINAIVVPFIAVSAARNPQWSPDVYVSRQMVLHTATLVGVGVYLLAMASAGYYVRYFGGSWGVVAQAVFFFAASLLLLSLLFSGQLKAKVRVFISKHFFNYKYDYREEWLHFVAILAENSAAPLGERVIQSIARMVESPAGMLWQLRDLSYTPTFAWNCSLPEGLSEPLSSPFLCFLQEQEWIVEKGARGSAACPIPLPPWFSDLGELWLIIPFIHRDALIAFLVLERSRAGLVLEWEDRDLLRATARQAASYLASQEAAEQLAQAQQFAAFHRFSAFVVHDLKNLTAQLSLLVRNAAHHKYNPEFIDDAVQTIEHAVKRMQRLMDHLRGAGDSEQQEVFDVVALVHEVVKHYTLRRPLPEVKEGNGAFIGIYAHRERFGTILGHLIQNAQEATLPEGCITLQVNQEGDFAQIKIEDTGRGMDPAFIRDRLFRPFDSTKGLTGMGIGVFEVREYVRALGGEVNVRSAPGKGTCFVLRVPLCSMAESRTMAAKGAAS